MALSDAIKKIAQQTNTVGVPTAFLYGEVVGISPLRVLVDSRFELTSTFLVIPAHLPQNDFAEGERIILLRNQGGNEFLVLGKVGNNGTDT